MQSLYRHGKLFALLVVFVGVVLIGVGVRGLVILFCRELVPLGDEAVFLDRRTLVVLEGLELVVLAALE